jgi:hypothetical protein
MRYLFLGIGLMLLSACSVQQLENYDANFEGRWRSIVYNSPTAGDSIRNYLIVDGKNSAFGLSCKRDLSCELCDCLIFQSGRAKINTSTNALQVGGTVGQISTITQLPFENEEGVWELEIDNVPYFRY